METYVANVHSDTAVPIGIIVAILSFIQSMISACPTPPAPADIISGGGIVGTLRLNMAIRKASDIKPWSAEGRKLAASMQANASKVTEADAKLFMSMAQED